MFSWILSPVREASSASRTCLWKTCHRARQPRRCPCSLTRKEIISHLIKYLWVHLLFIYFDQCVPFHAAVVLYVGDPQIASLVDIMGLQCQLTLTEITSGVCESQMQLQSRAICYRVSSILCIAPLSHSSRLEKLPPLWLNVMEMGNHWEDVVFFGSPSAQRPESQQPSADDDYMSGKAGNGHAWCLTSC